MGYINIVWWLRNNREVKHYGRVPYKWDRLEQKMASIRKFFGLRNQKGSPVAHSPYSLALCALVNMMPWSYILAMDLPTVLYILYVEIYYISRGMRYTSGYLICTSGSVFRSGCMLWNQIYNIHLDVYCTACSVCHMMPCDALLINTKQVDEVRVWHKCEYFVRKKQPSCPLLFNLLKKDKGKKKVAVKSWSKDIVCLPADYYSRSQELSIPWVKQKSQTCKGPVDRQGVAVVSYVWGRYKNRDCSVFSVALDEEMYFQVSSDNWGWITVLECPMHSFQWTAKDVVSSAGKGAVYILAEKQTSAFKEHIMKCYWFAFMRLPLYRTGRSWCCCSSNQVICLCDGSSAATLNGCRWPGSREWQLMTKWNEMARAHLWEQWKKWHPLPSPTLLWLTDWFTNWLCVMCYVCICTVLGAVRSCLWLKASPGKIRVPYPYQWALLNSCQADLLPLGLCQQPPPAHVPLKYPLFLPLCQNVNCGPASGPNYDYCSFKEKMDMAKLVAVQTL